MLDLPRLTASPPGACTLCGTPAPRLLGQRDFGDSCNDAFSTEGRTFPSYGVPIAYYRCSHCAFSFTNAFDDWTSDDFRQYVYNESYVRSDPPFLHERPLRHAQIVAGIWHYELAELTLLDYGGGNGAFAAELKKRGGRCDSCDLFYGEVPRQKQYPLVTCFEVIEHVPHAQQIEWFTELSTHVDPKGLVFLSTLLLTPKTPVEHSYLSPRNGHISVHSCVSLRHLAARFGFALSSLNDQFHMLRRSQKAPPI